MGKEPNCIPDIVLKHTNGGYTNETPTTPVLPNIPTLLNIPTPLTLVGRGLGQQARGLFNFFLPEVCGLSCIEYAPLQAALANPNLNPDPNSWSVHQYRR